MRVESAAFTKVLLLVCLLTTTTTSVAKRRSRRKCLSGFRTTSVTATSFSLAWDYSCLEEAAAPPGVKYKVYYHHQEWMACGSEQRRRDSRKGSGRGDLEVTDATVADVSGLHPHSRYFVSIKALPPAAALPPEEMELEVETEDDRPSAKPVAADIAVEATETSLRFRWRPPSDCRSFNGFLDGYDFVLRGADRWNDDDDDERRGRTPSTNRRFDRLRPMSRYVLLVRAVTSAGGFRSPALTMEAATRPLPTPSDPPTDLSVIWNDDGSFWARWMPPYPPTSLVSAYVVRWKTSDGGWLTANVVNSSTCDDDPEERICFSVPNDNGRRNLTVQVAALSPQNNRSPWSASAWIDVDDRSHGANLAVAVIVSAVVLFSVILLAVCVRHKLHRHKSATYNNVPVYVESKDDRPDDDAAAEDEAMAMSTFGGVSVRSSFTRGGGRGSLAGSVDEAAATKDYSHLFLPLKDPELPTTTTTPSIQETPLPPVPGKEPIYEELCQETLLKNQRPSIGSSNLHIAPSGGGGGGMNGGCCVVVDGEADSEDDFLEPSATTLSSGNNHDDDEEESDYLEPRNDRKAAVAAASDDNDNEEYLKPVFNQVKIIDPHSMSPPSEKPPAIPIESYTPVTSNSK